MKTSIKLSNEPVLDLYDLFTTPLRSETQQRHFHTIHMEEILYCLVYKYC